MKERKEKPWGWEELIEHNSLYVLKKLKMNQGCRCSLQYHEKKKETVYVIEGSILVYTGSSEKDLEAEYYFPGQSLTIDPGTVHRMESSEGCIYLEASTPELDDVVRLDDDYDRV